MNRHEIGGIGMIVNYKFRNFMSFNDEAEFSMQASSTKVKQRYTENFIKTDVGYDVLKTSVIVGENAGGKSNFIRSLMYLQYLFVTNGRPRIAKNTINWNNNIPTCNRKNTNTQAFELTAIIQNQIYCYNLELDVEGIIIESLTKRRKKNDNPITIFNIRRAISEYTCNEESCEHTDCSYSITMGYDIEIQDEKIGKFINDVGPDRIKKQPGLFINKLAILGEKDCVIFSDYFRDGVVPYINYINFDIFREMKNDQDDLRILKDKKFFDIFKLVDYSIVRFELDEEKPYSKTVIIRKRKDGSEISRELSEDSSGVREFFAWAVLIYKVVYENKCVFADEMDRVLNPVLSDRIISFLHGIDHTGQFIFTTHNVLHLELKTYMKEQIYFVTKDKESLESEIYSLADFPEIRYETTKIYDFYMKGILGGTAFE